jgi:outer membrane receptor protein involved in Fe transport
MKKLILITIAVCFSFTLSAQNSPKTVTIKGTTVDSLTKKPLDFVTAALQDAKTKLPVKSTLTKDDGSFELTAPAGKSYQLVLAFVGYNTKLITITDTLGNTDAGKIILSASNKTLNEVSISAVKPLMKREVDRISYDVQADPESKALSALDMMRKVPLLSVDASDNIKLKGNGNYKILINGKESALVAKNPSDILKAMPATNVEKIEVITTPPAKYDAEGLAGIINIITKKNADQGYNIGVNGRYNSIWGPGININGTVKQGKFGMSGYAGLGRQNPQQAEFGSTQNFFKDQMVLSQSGTNAFRGNYNYANAELSYEIDSLNLLTGSFEMYGNKYGQDANQISDVVKANVLNQHYTLSNSSDGKYLGGGLALNYQLGFKNQKDRLLTLSYKYNYSPNEQFTDNLFSQRLNYPVADHPDFQQYNKSGNKEHTVQVDYVHPLKKVNIEAGAKAILRNNFSDYHLDNKDASGNYITNPAQTNNFDYHQDVYSVYNSYQVKLEKWTAKAGLRLEHTVINANFASTGSAVDRSYDNLIPSVSIQRSFKTSSFNLGFTQRIQRPSIWQLNPFIDNSNPKFISTGNPDLRPELNNTFELTYSNFAKTASNIGLSYAFSNNSIQNVSGLEYRNTGGRIDTITTTTYRNLGSNRNLGLNFNTNFNVGKQFSFSINAQLSHVWLKGNYNGELYENDGYTGNAFANAGYKFGKGYRLGIDAGYFSGDVVLQGQSSKFIYSSYVLSKEFLDKKATISLVANNPYSKYQYYRSTTTTADYYQSSFNQNYYRTFAVRFNYKFGKLNSEIKKNKRGISNDDTKGGGKSSGGN